MKLCATIKGDTGKTVQKTSNRSLEIDITVNRVSIGSIWIDYHDDINNYNSESDEWVLMFKPQGSEDGNVIAQGHVESKSI